MVRPFPAVFLCAFLLTPTITLAQDTSPAEAAPSQQTATPASPSNVLQTTVRRVVLDVVVTDAKGKPVPGLSASDFTVNEDNTPQKILSFDASSFSPGMDYVPPPLPPQPAGSYIDLPAAPEKGPLYVLFYDMVNIESPEQETTAEGHNIQPYATAQLMKFIQSKPDGTRFAIFVRTDGLHLVQGFTSDKSLLYRALDPHHPGPHVPAIFLNASNFGRGDQVSAMNMLHDIAVFLDGLPGRKNIIWFSSQFPLSLFADESQGAPFEEETKATIELMAHNQIAIYPVDARGVAFSDSHGAISTSPHSDTVSDSSSGSNSNAGGGGGSQPTQNSSMMEGTSAVASSYDVMDEVARETGGRAFHGNNDLAVQLQQATTDGGSFYTLTYSPTNKDYDGKVRHIKVDLDKKGDQLSYRRQYYATPARGSDETAKDTVVANPAQTASDQPLISDTLATDMQFGAPTMHQLVYIMQAHNLGTPAPGTPEQMANLATEPAYFKSRRKAATPRPLAPIPLQKVDLSFFIPTRQFKDEPSPTLEVAAAAYDANGVMMNGSISQSKPAADATPATANTPRFYRAEQTFEVPQGATTLRVAVRDTANDRIGAMEIHLPLPPETATR
jgi:VWFA-related protein